LRRGVRWTLRAAVVLAVAYPLALLALGWALDGWITAKTRARVAAALDADVTIDDVSVNLLTGRVTMRGLRVSRRGVGALDVAVARASARVASWGRLAYDRDVREARVSGVTIDVDAAGVATLPRRARPPADLTIGSFVMDDARVTVVATRFLPGLARAELRVARARTGRVAMRDSLSWLYRLTELSASVDVGGTATVGVGYDGKSLSLSGSVFGSTPLVVSVTAPETAEDGHELGTLQAWGTALGQSIAIELGRRELRRRLGSN
jgi:hypothetical protein